MTAKAESSENRSASDYSLYVLHAVVQSTSVRTGRPLIPKNLNTGRGRAKKFVLGLALLLWKLFFQTLKMGDGVRAEEMLNKVSQVESI